MHTRGRWSVVDGRGASRHAEGMTVLRVLLAVFILTGLVSAGGMGAAVAGTAWYIENRLPPVNQFNGLDVQTTKIYDRNGTLLYDVVDEETGRRQEAKLSDVSQWVISATIATEDASFYSNPGVDPVGIVRALFNPLDHGDRQIPEARRIILRTGVERGELCADRFQIDGRRRHLPLLERRQCQPMPAQLLPIELGLLAETGPDDGLPGVVDPVRQPHPLVVRDAGDDRRERGRDPPERVVVVVEHDHEPGPAETRPLAAIESLSRRGQRFAHESIVRPFTLHR